MFLKSLHIENFKSFEDVIFEFNPTVNIFTGVNNTGKTTILEAIALWQECFVKLLQQAKRTQKNYKKGDYIIDNTLLKYFKFEDINSIRSPAFEDIFFDKETNRIVKIGATFQNEENENITITILIRNIAGNCIVELDDFKNFSFLKFNEFFKKFPNPITLSYASPVSNIAQNERFMTFPNVKEMMTGHNSVSILRNRLSLLYNERTETNYRNFLNDLNDALYGNDAKLKFYEITKSRDDSKVIFHYTIGDETTTKDISLLGSGTLQIMEILLHLHYKESEPDLRIILLDEPDSHIHRDIQKRLLSILAQKISNTQIFLTTHNENFIRNADVSQLFHLENTPKNHYKTIDIERLSKIDETQKTRKSFSGIYPTHINPIIKTLGNGGMGLDFIDALEADKIIFVEGEDDAQMIYFLLQKTYSTPNPNKYVFWVMNGISNILKNIAGYKHIFEQIKNKKTLWEKSYLIMDKDILSNEHAQRMTEKIKNVLGIDVFVPSAYTFETILLSDLSKLSLLITQWFSKLDIAPLHTTHEEIEKTYQSLGKMLEERYFGQNSLEKQNKDIFIYLDRKNKLDMLLNEGKADKNSVITQPNLTLYYQKYIKDCIQEGKFYKLATKDDLSWFFDEILKPYNKTFDLEKDFLALLESVYINNWYSDWDFMRTLAK